MRILLYHGIVPAPVRRINARFLSSEAFEAQMAFVTRHFQVVSLEQALRGDYDPQRFAVAVTFDDGYRNNLLHAVPILQKHAVPATFFVSTPAAVGKEMLWADRLDIASSLSSGPVKIAGKAFHKDRKGEFVDQSGIRLKAFCKTEGAEFIAEMEAAFADVQIADDPQWTDYWKLMQPEDLRTLAETDGMVVGGHGCLHINLDRLPLPVALQDVSANLRYLASATGKPISTFAYPDGAYSPTLVAELGKLGINQQLLVDRNPLVQNDPRLRERFTIHPFLPTKVLMAEILRGHYF